MANQESSNNYINTHIHKGWLAALAALVVLFAAFVFGLAAGRFSYGFGNRAHGFIGGTTLKQESQDGFITHRMMSNIQDRIIGTVTATNGSSLTVAGGGSSYSVETNS